MRIGIDARAAVWYRGTGMGTYTYQLMTSLCQQDQKNQYRFLLPAGQETHCGDFTAVTFEDLGQTKDFFWEEVYAAPLCPEGLDLYHVPHNGIGLPEDVTCKKVVTVHDVIPAVMPEATGGGYRTIFMKDMPRILEQSDAVVTVSQHSAQDLKTYFQVPPEKLHVIYQGVEAIYRPLDQEVVGQHLASHYGLTGPYFLYLGGFGARKNVSLLLEAFRRYRAQNNTCRLVLIGRNSPGFFRILKEIEALGEAVLSLGFLPVAELPYFYNGATAFVYPSLYEGFGLPPLEAMSCGTPLICSNASSLPEVAGDAALLFSPQDRDALAQGMYNLAIDQSLREGLRQKGLARAQDFCWQNTAKKIINLYNDLLLCKN